LALDGVRCGDGEGEDAECDQAERSSQQPAIEIGHAEALADASAARGER
jgi:hypothetical protein